MSQLYTNNGKPLAVSGDDILYRNGRHVGRCRGAQGLCPDGRYADTIVGDQVVHRSTDRATFAPRAGTGSARADRAGSAKWGDEPFE